MEGDETLNLKQLARRLGCAPPAIRRWLRQGLPAERDSRGHWKIRLAAAIAWQKSQDHSHRPLTAAYGIDGGADHPDGDTLQSLRVRALQEDIRRKRADADRKTWLHERERTAHRMCELADVELFISQWLAEARNILLRVPTKLQRFGHDISHAAEQELKLALHAIRKKSERLVELKKDDQ